METTNDTKELKSTPSKLAYQKEYYLKHKEKYKTIMRERYQEANKDKPREIKEPKEPKQPKVYKIPKGNTPEEYRENKLAYQKIYYNNIEKERREALNVFIKTNLKETIKERKKTINKELQNEILEATKLQRKALKNTTEPTAKKDVAIVKREIGG